MIVNNLQHASASRVTVLGLVCLLSHISPMELLFVMETLFPYSVDNGDLPETTAFKSNVANQYSDLHAVSFLSAKHQRVPNDCKQHSALPKTMPTDAVNPCCSQN